MATDTPAPVAIIGGYFTSNMGGAGMTQAVVSHVRGKGMRTAVLTLYPSGDKPHAPDDADLVPWRPQDIVLSTPLAVLAFLARLLRLPMGPFLRTPGLRAMASARVVVDVAGISFVDGRGPAIVAYNTLMTGLPLLLGTPVVKMAQAMGPFHGRLNRFMARMVLPRVRTVVARGERTASHLRDLGVANSTSAADIAFSMPVDEKAAWAAAKAIRDSVGGEPFVCLVPSSVVKAYCDEQGIDYTGQLSEVARRIRDHSGHQVLVLAHSVHPSGREGRMHDVTVAEDVVRRSDGAATLLPVGLGPDGLRAAIGHADALVTSRFHAMVSGLATTTPTLVIGWSHKYQEVLGQFGQDIWAVNYADLDATHITTQVQQLLQQADDIRERIRDHLPEVEASARRNLDVIDGVLDPSGA